MYRELILLYLLWGCNWSVMKACAEFFSPLSCSTLRFVIGAAVLLAASFAMRRRIPERRHWPWIAVVGATQVAYCNVAMQMCIADLGAGLAAVISYCMPLWMAVMAHFFLDERLTLRKAGGILVSIGGIAMLAGVGGGSSFGIEPLLWCISSSVVWAASGIVIKLRLKDCDGMALTTWQMAIGAAMLLGVTAVVPQPAPVWTLKSAALMAYNGVLASAVAFFLWMHILSKMEAAKAGAYVLVVPVVGVLSGIVFLGESLSAAGLLGIALVLGGVMAVQRSPKAGASGS
ncbi:MAG: EamA family transporter [Mailhella sp.]|nr:EamA family transporter [Mailhella sp.]